MKISIANWSFIVTLIICMGIPIGSLIYIALKKKSCLKPFFMGVLVFIVSQMVLRIPIIQVVLPNFDWYNNMPMLYPIVYLIFMSFSAGVFEEIGRYIGFKGLKKNRTWKDGIAFGLGHGGIEALMITGVTTINNMVVVNSVNNGTFDGAKLGVSESTIIGMFENITNTDILLGGVERISAMILHVFLTMIVLYAIKQRKKIYVVLSILAHGLVDFSVISLISNGINTLAVEIGFFIVALGLLAAVIKSKKTFDNIDEKELSNNL